jgi:hypothetical protein
MRVHDGATGVAEMFLTLSVVVNVGPSSTPSSTVIGAGHAGRSQPP